MYEKSQIQCYNYKKYGHYASECWNRAPNHIEEESNYIEEEHAVLLPFKGEVSETCAILIQMPAVICVKRRTYSRNLMNQ